MLSLCKIYFFHKIGVPENDRNVFIERKINTVNLVLVKNNYFSLCTN